MRTRVDDAKIAFNLMSQSEQVEFLGWILAHRQVDVDFEIGNKGAGDGFLDIDIDITVKYGQDVVLSASGSDSIGIPY